MEDNQLIKNFLDGDNNSFDMLYSKYRKPLYSYIYKLSYNNANISDDIFQQTWIRIIKKLEKYSHREKFIYWAFTIARNIMIDNVRKNAKHKNNIATDLLREEGIELAQDHKEPWHDLNNQEISGAIESAVNKLPNALKEVFIMRNNDISFKDIAKIQECSINTALSRMKYALKKLRVELVHLQEEEI